jgi:hypothetical protein
VLRVPGRSLLEGSHRKVFRDCSLWPSILRTSPPRRRAANGKMEMNAQVTELQAAENDLKQLMADVTRAMEKAQEAVARIASKAAAVTTARPGGEFGTSSVARLCE